MLGQAIEAAVKRGLASPGDYVVCVSTENHSIQLKIVAVNDYGQIHHSQGTSHDGDSCLFPLRISGMQRAPLIATASVVCVTTENHSIQLKIVAVNDYGQIHHSQGTSHDGVPPALPSSHFFTHLLHAKSILCCDCELEAAAWSTGKAEEFNVGDTRRRAHECSAVSGLHGLTCTMSPAVTITAPSLCMIAWLMCCRS